MAELFRMKLQVGYVSVSQIDEALSKVWPKFVEEAGNNCIWDKTTPHELTAREQLKYMAAAFLPSLEYINPFKIEVEYKRLVSPLGGDAIPILLTGHIDLLDDRYFINDWKTSGKGFPSVYAQMGGYAILVRLEDGKADGVRINYVPRKGITKLEEIAAGFRSITLPIEVCVETAWANLKEIQRHYMNYRESGGDPLSFPANPMSYLCTLNNCTAFGTTYCKVGCTL